MDKLRLAFKLVAERAKAKREAGSVPAFLGARGLLALMYDRIATFSQAEEDASEYVLDLAVMAMFAFSTCLPDMDINDDHEEEALTETNDEGPTSEEEETMAVESNTDPRWTPVRPGDPLPTVGPIRREADEQSS